MTAGNLEPTCSPISSSAQSHSLDDTTSSELDAQRQKLTSAQQAQVDKKKSDKKKAQEEEEEKKAKSDRNNNCASSSSTSPKCDQSSEQKAGVNQIQCVQSSGQHNHQTDHDEDHSSSSSQQTKRAENFLQQQQQQPFAHHYYGQTNIRPHHHQQAISIYSPPSSHFLNNTTSSLNNHNFVQQHHAPSLHYALASALPPPPPQAHLHHHHHHQSEPSPSFYQHDQPLLTWTCPITGSHHYHHQLPLQPPLPAQAHALFYNPRFSLHHQQQAAANYQQQHFIAQQAHFVAGSLPLPPPPPLIAPGQLRGEHLPPPTQSRTTNDDDQHASIIENQRNVGNGSSAARLGDDMKSAHAQQQQQSDTERSRQAQSPSSSPLDTVALGAACGLISCDDKKTTAFVVSAGDKNEVADCNQRRETTQQERQERANKQLNKISYRRQSVVVGDDDEKEADAHGVADGDDDDERGSCCCCCRSLCSTTNETKSGTHDEATTATRATLGNSSCNDNGKSAVLAVSQQQQHQDVGLCCHHQKLSTSVTSDKVKYSTTAKKSSPTLHEGKRCSCTTATAGAVDQAQANLMLEPEEASNKRQQVATCGEDKEEEDAPDESNRPEPNPLRGAPPILKRESASTCDKDFDDEQPASSQVQAGTEQSKTPAHLNQISINGTTFYHVNPATLFQQQQFLSHAPAQVPQFFLSYHPGNSSPYPTAAAGFLDPYFASYPPPPLPLRGSSCVMLPSHQPSSVPVPHPNTASTAFAYHHHPSWLPPLPPRPLELQEQVYEQQQQWQPLQPFLSAGLPCEPTHGMPTAPFPPLPYHNKQSSLLGVEDEHQINIKQQQAAIANVSLLKLGYNLIPLLPINAIPTRIRQAYGMDKVWQDEFEQLFSQFAACSQVVWTLVEVETNPNIRNSAKILDYKNRYIVRVDCAPNHSATNGESDICNIGDDYDDHDSYHYRSGTSTTNVMVENLNPDNDDDEELERDREEEDDTTSTEHDNDDSSSLTNDCASGDLNQADGNQQSLLLSSNEIESRSSNCESDCDSGAILNSSSTSGDSTSSSSGAETAARQDVELCSVVGTNREQVTDANLPDSGTTSSTTNVVDDRKGPATSCDVKPPHQHMRSASGAQVSATRNFPLRFRMFIDSAKVRFCCETCGHGWTSMKGRVVFWYELFELVDSLDAAATTGRIAMYTEQQQQQHQSGVSNLIGYCAYKLFGQQCDVCKVENRFERPMWYPEEVTKVLCNLYNKIGQVYFGFRMPTIDKQRRAGKPKTSHNSLLCQACHDGVCTDRK